MMLIEVILLLILVACGLSGYRKGLLMSLCTLLILVLCSLGASVAQELFAPKAVAFLEPKVQQMVEQQLREQAEKGTRQAVEEAGESEITVGGQEVPLGDLMDMLKRFGVDVEQQAAEGAGAAIEPMMETASHAVARAVVQPIAELLIYLAAFLILYLLLHSVALLVNVVERLPMIHTLNQMGGAVAGVLGGLLFLTVVLVVCRRTGWMTEDVSSGPLGMLLGKLVDQLA